MDSKKEYLKSFVFSQEQFNQIKEYCREHNEKFFRTFINGVEYTQPILPGSFPLYDDAVYVAINIRKAPVIRTEVTNDSIFYYREGEVIKTEE